MFVVGHATSLEQVSFLDKQGAKALNNRPLGLKNCEPLPPGSCSFTERKKRLQANIVSAKGHRGSDRSEMERAAESDRESTLSPSISVRCP